MRLTIIMLSVAAAGAAAPGAAKAQLFWQPGEPAAVPYPPGSGGWDARNASRAPKPTCEKMCADDFSPCDPIYFKTEDGRCAGITFR